MAIQLKPVSRQTVVMTGVIAAAAGLATARMVRGRRH